MRLSTKGRFAVTAMMDIALHESYGPVPLSSVALRHPISLSYLEQMFSKLRQHGLVRSTRGPGGGYTLGHLADGITVADIVRAMDGQAADEGPETKARHDPVSPDMSQDLWDALDSKMAEYLHSVTLRNLADEQRAKGLVAPPARPTKKGVAAQTPKKPAWANTPNSVFALGESLLPKAV
jgi:Rrf2 family transcriptional regulator, iron-sulfur cluster assembly transcription factor